MRFSVVSLFLPLANLASVCCTASGLPFDGKVEEMELDALIASGAVIPIDTRLTPGSFDAGNFNASALNGSLARPPAQKQKPQQPDPNYRIPPDTFAYLVSKPGSPRVGQPMVHVTLDKQIRKSRRTNETYAYYVLDVDARSFVGGYYSKANLYVGCQSPARNETQVAQGNEDAVKWNFDSNCHIGHNNLNTKCEVPLMHLAHDRQKSTGCRRKGSDFACDSKIFVAFHADVVKTDQGGGGGEDQKFELWGQGTCINPEGKKTERKKPLCDEKKVTIAQWFEVEIDCDQKE